MVPIKRQKVTKMTDMTDIPYEGSLEESRSVCFEELIQKIEELKEEHPENIVKEAAAEAAEEANI